MAVSTGPVTFLFTDIEGSTRLWEDHHDAMREALARHDDLLRASIERHRGVVFKTIGDAFCASFPDATLAVQAAIDGQLAMDAAKVDGQPLRVRMALHSGMAEERDGDYFGPPLNRTARLLAIGHGGQVLVSAAARELAGDDLPIPAALADRGRHRLKDLKEPEHVFELRHPQLGENFPPLRSLSTHPNNLPQHLTSFIGREAEMREIRERLESARLLTLVGAGGCGKSRLALQAAADMLERFPDGIWLVELAPLSDPDLVAQTIASTLSLKDEPGRPILDTLVDHLRSKRTTLLLDNCEHLLDACSRLADAILKRCANVVIMATSRESLGIMGETTYRVPSLSVPNRVLTQSTENIRQFDSVRLFVDRAQALDSKFCVTDLNASALASICHRLDGIPLAIELAAARTRAMTVEEINSRLDQRFRLLTGGSRAALPRQQTLRSLIDWSYDLLNPAEKKLLQRVSVFAGGWTLDAAENVCSDDPVEQWDVLDLLTSLVDKSLVIVDESRYRLLETVRQYARDRLLEGGEMEQCRDNHFQHFFKLVETARSHLSGADQQIWLEKLESEHDNLRSALDYRFEDENHVDEYVGFARSLSWFWYLRGHWSEGRGWLDRAVAVSESLPVVSRIAAIYAAAILPHAQCDYESALQLYDQALQLAREIDDSERAAWSLGNKGAIELERGHIAQAVALSNEALELFRLVEDKRGVAAVLGVIADAAIENEDYPHAETHATESLKLRVGLDDRAGAATAELTLALLAIRRGDPKAARPHLLEALRYVRELLLRNRLPDVLDDCAEYGLAFGRQEESVVLLAMADTLRSEIGAPILPINRARHEKRIVAAKTELGNERFDQIWQEGLATSMEEAMDYAFRLLES